MQRVQRPAKRAQPSLAHAAFWRAHYRNETLAQACYRDRQSVAMRHAPQERRASKVVWRVIVSAR